MKASAAQKLETVEEQETPITSARVTSLHPLVWEQAKAWTRRAFIEERIAEPALVTATLFLWGLLLFSLYQALENYTISPWP